jgi:hypothetical protein
VRLTSLIAAGKKIRAIRRKEVRQAKSEERDLEQKKTLSFLSFQE